MSGLRREILLFDVDLATIALYQRELSRVFTVIATTDSDAILKILLQHPIAAVVLEPAASGGAGWDVVANIRHECRARSIPIILCSTLDERRRGLDLGAAVYLVKPT